MKDAVSFIGKFEAAVAHYADRYDVDAVLCGHIHSAAIREFGKVTYYNCGDWVESCTALVEGDRRYSVHGQLRILLGLSAKKSVCHAIDIE